jgi:hypothetical protein
MRRFVYLLDYAPSGSRAVGVRLPGKPHSAILGVFESGTGNCRRLHGHLAYFRIAKSKLDNRKVNASALPADFDTA